MENIYKLSSEKENQTSNQEVVNTASINNQTPQVETSTKLVFSRLPYIIFTLLVIVFLSVLAGVFPYNKNTTFKKMKDTEVQITNIELSPIPTQVNQQQRQQKLKRWVLKKKINGESQTIVSLCGNCYANYIEQWIDWIFYPDFENNSIQIKGYNLKTSESKIIYDLNQNNNDFQGGAKGLPREISDMQVINNTLFFSLGGYLTSGGVFWVDLPPTTKPQKLADSRNAKITYWKNRYWIIGGEGDACWSFTDYSLIDLTSKKVNHIASSITGCIEGEEYVDIDKRERMILAFHTQDFGNYKDGIYQYVIGVPLLNPSVKEEIIAKQNMPPDITSIKYLENSDQLLLIGKEKYLYDFSSKTINKTEMVVPTPTFAPEIQNNTFEDKIKRLNLPNEYEFVLE